jgi:hypothetical protein
MEARLPLLSAVLGHVPPAEDPTAGWQPWRAAWARDPAPGQPPTRPKTQIGDAMSTPQPTSPHMKILLAEEDETTRLFLAENVARHIFRVLCPGWLCAGAVRRIVSGLPRPQHARRQVAVAEMSRRSVPPRRSCLA